MTGRRTDPARAAQTGALGALPLAELAERLGGDGGLTSRVAARRARGHANEVAGIRVLARALQVVRAIFNPLVIVLVVAGTAAAFLGEIVDAVIIALIVVLSGAIEAWLTLRSERAVSSLQDRVAPTATAKRDGEWREVARRELVPGDRIRLSAGDLVPADARLLTARDLHVQQAALTGEPVPAEKSASTGAIDAVSADAPELVFLGTSIVSGSAEALVYATGGDTAFGDIVERLAERPDETEFERGLRRFGGLIVRTVVVLVVFILVVQIGSGRDPLQSLLFAVALAVGLTPEFLPMITSVTLARGALAMAGEKVIVKHLSAIQNLGSMDVLCSDKTGTLTAGTVGLDASLAFDGSPSPRALELAAVNSRVQTGVKSPLDAAILACTHGDGWTKLDEIPFDFERRRVSVVVERAGERLLVVKGAPEGVVALCTRIETDGRALDEAVSKRIEETLRGLGERGIRVLAVACRDVPAQPAYAIGDERDLVLVGFVTFTDHILEGTEESLANLRRDGVEVKILTGDGEAVTRHVCAQVGIDPGEVVLGASIDRLDEPALARVAERACVFARVSPAQKHRIVRALRSRGRVVGFLGDGINDAPSLHAADVGISVAGAVDVAREAADIVLLERRLDVLHAGIVAGRRSSANVLKYILMGTSSNFGNMFSMAAAALFLPFLPMLPTQILLNNFLYDLAQLSIPTDHVDPAYLRRPQRWDIDSIRNFMLIVGPLSSIYDFVTFYVLLVVLHASETEFHTGWFVESLATQTFVLFVIRTAGRPWVEPPSWPVAATALLAVAIGLTLPYTALAPALGFTPLPPVYFVFLAIVVVTYLAIVEAVKGRLRTRLFPGTDRGSRS